MIRLTVFAFILVQCTGEGVGKTDLDVKDIASTITNYFMSQEHNHDCGWERATYFTGHMASYLLTKNESYKDYAKDWSEHYKWQTCNYPNTINEHSAANDYCITQTYGQLYELDKNETYISNSLHELGLIVNRTQVDDYWWVDSFFMGLPSFAILSNITGDRAYSEKMFALFNDTCINRTMWDEEASLFYRDQTYIGKASPHGEKVFWARGNGWAMAGMTRAIRWMSPQDPHRDDLIIKLKAMANTLRTIQGEDGFWRASLLDPLDCPGPETTGTAMFTFGLAALVNDGILDSSFKPTVEKAWKGLTSLAIHDNGAVGYCQPVGGGPANATSDSTSDFCVGQVLLAVSEMERFIL